MASPVSADRPRGRPRADESMALEKILGVALTAFATYGYDGVAMRTLNRELGVSHSLLYQRFGSKDVLWRAAVDYGFSTLVRQIQGIFDPTLTEPLEQLRLAVRLFLVYSAEHPELLGLMNIEARQSTDRLSYVYETYIEPSLRDIGRLLTYLADEGVIRPIPLRTFFFLVAHGATAPFSLIPLATKFDPSSPCDPEAVDAHAQLVSTVLIEGLRLHR